MKSQIYNPAYIVLARIVSVLMSPAYYFFNLFRKSYDFNTKLLKTILVTEYHRIGDVIIIIPILKSLKLKFPNSKIILVCNPTVAKLALEIGIADEIIGFRAPWTEWEWSPFKWVRARALAKKIGKKDIDLVIDFKGDLRNSWFLWQIGGKNSLGYSTTGGSYFYTMPKPFPSKIHQADRAMELISFLGCEPFNVHKNFKYNKNNSIVLHPGVMDPRRAWPDKFWMKLIDLLSANEKVALVKTPETHGLIQQVIQEGIPVEIFEGDLIDFYHWLSGQKLFIGPDSMSGHLATHLNIPVISIFGSQDPKYTRPLGEWASCITPKTPCGHKRDHWRLCEKCMESIKPKIVYSKATELISRVENE